MHVTDREVFDPVRGGLILMDEIREMAGEKFEFIGKEKFHLDLLLGTDDYRIGRKTSVQLLEENQPKIAAFAEKTKKYRLYD